MPDARQRKEIVFVDVAAAARLLDSGNRALFVLPEFLRIRALHAFDERQIAKDKVISRAILREHPQMAACCLWRSPTPLLCSAKREIVRNEKLQEAFLSRRSSLARQARKGLQSFPGWSLSFFCRMKQVTAQAPGGRHDVRRDT